MDQQRIDILTQKIADRTISDQELNEYYEWLNSDDGKAFQVSNTESREELQRRIYVNIATEAGFDILQPKSIRLWPRIFIAAAVATIIVSAGLWFMNRKAGPEKQEIAYQNDVAPGKQGAILTLANGTKIKLTDTKDGEIASQAGVTITKNAKGELIYEVKQQEKTSSDLGAINTLETANGETYQVRLPDGSTVWLNSASSITYAANLMQNSKRRVKLKGEGFFEVAKDKAHPFIVQTSTQEVEVLGTQFNVNSYKDEPAVATTLVEGSVKVTTGNKKQIIRPGEQTLNAGTKLQIKKVNIDNIIDWKEGDFTLEDVPFKAAMRKIARWYDVELVYESSVPENIESFGMISRKQPLSAVLDMVQKSGQVKFKIQGRKVIVTK